MTIRNAVLGLALVPSASAHFMWMWNASGTCSVTFNEQAGVASPVTGPAGIDLVADKTQVWVQGTAAGAKKQYIELGIEPLGEEGVMLAAAIPAVPPFAMELRTEFGIYGGGGSGGGGGGGGGHGGKLLIYYSSAPSVQRPSDWFAVQDASPSTDGLQITIRDANMLGGTAGEGVLGPPFPAEPSPADQCPPGIAWHEGEACVVAVVRFNGTLLTAPHNITTYVSENGNPAQTIRVAQTRGGVTVLRLPPRGFGAELYYASVNHIEPRAGTYNGTTYHTVDHWATTSTTLHRSYVAPSPTPASPPSPPPPHLPPWPVQPPPPGAPPSPPPPPVPWWVNKFLGNSFGGAFGGAFLACFVFVLVLLLGWGCSKVGASDGF